MNKREKLAKEIFEANKEIITYGKYEDLADLIICIGANETLDNYIKHKKYIESQNMIEAIETIKLYTDV